MPPELFKRSLVVREDQVFLSLYAAILLEIIKTVLVATVVQNWTIESYTSKAIERWKLAEHLVYA